MHDENLLHSPALILASPSQQTLSDDSTMIYPEITLRHWST